MSSILVVGSANVDLVVSAGHLPMPGETLLGGRFATFLGGKGANQAVAAARAGGRVRFVGCVGEDDAGTRLLSGLRREGVDVDFVAVTSVASGVALITTVPGGDNTIVVASGANLELHDGLVDERAFDDAGVLLCQLEIPIETVRHAISRAHGRGATVVLDPAPAAPLPLRILRDGGWLTPNESEAGALLGDPGAGEAPIEAARALRDRYGGGVVLTLGARGAVLLPPGAQADIVPAWAVGAVDTTAAGDAFNGAFGVALSEGMNALAAVEFAMRAASIAVSRPGAQAAMATRDEIEAAVRSGVVSTR